MRDRRPASCWAVLTKVPRTESSTAQGMKLSWRLRNLENSKSPLRRARGPEVLMATAHTSHLAHQSASLRCSHWNLRASRSSKGERNLVYANEARRFLNCHKTFISSAVRLELSIRGTSVSTAHQWPGAYLSYIPIAKSTFWKMFKTTKAS